jgi:hypothetical protein
MAVIVEIAFPSRRLLTKMNVLDFGPAACPSAISALPAARASGFSCVMLTGHRPASRRRASTIQIIPSVSWPQYSSSSRRTRWRSASGTSVKCTRRNSRLAQTVQVS